MGRQEEPTQEELEFIFGCMARGLSPSEILDEMQDTEFPLRGREFISRKRKYFDAAKKVLQTHVESKEDPLLTWAVEKHFIDIRNFGEEVTVFLAELREWAMQAPFGKYRPSINDDEYIQLKAKIRRIESNQRFKYLNVHVPNSDLWESYDQIFDRIHQYVCVNNMIEKNMYLQEIKEHWQEITRFWGDRYDYNVDWDSNSPEDISDKLHDEIYDLIGSTMGALTLAISRHIFPGICPACPPGYRPDSSETQ